MPRVVETNRVYTRKLTVQHRSLEVTGRKQEDLHLKKTKSTTQPRVLTPGEKEARKERQADKKEFEAKKLAEAQEKVWKIAEGLSEDLGKTTDHWHQTLMQLARLAKSTRQTSQWNAYVSKRTAEKNAALRDGEPKVSVKDTGFIALLALEWAEMSEEERDAYTSDRRKEITEDRETKATGAHTVTVNAFHDVSNTVIKMENMLRELWMRTGAECLLFVVRSSVQQYNRPAVVESSPRVKNFFKFCFNQLPSQWVLNLEAHCINGMEGVKNKYAEDLQTLQAECSAKIFEQLQLAAAPRSVGRMNYENFGSITKRSRIVYQNWPVSFCSPVRLSVLELHTLHNLLHGSDPPPLFRKLTNAEYALFEATITKGTLQTLPPPPPINIPVPTLLHGPNNSVPENSREATNIPAVSASPLQGTTCPPNPSASSSISTLSGPTPGSLAPTPPRASTSSTLTSAAPSTSTTVAAPPTALHARGGIVISLDGRQSVLVPPKPRAKRSNAKTAEEKGGSKGSKGSGKAKSSGRKTGEASSRKAC
ncbi:hypothetical protein QCA50_014980 [Cerrena zonata]|uniref:Uncharacterized protein n=1 Tax=Cerrena zonata TaxID=2478898 RepID=A0AAW0FMH4_9APHY